MVNKEKLRQRFLHDPLPVRLGGLSATLGRISSSARESLSPTLVADLLDEAKHLIEWTAANAEPETAAELVQIQRLIVLWQKAWGTASSNRTQRILLSTLAKGWSDKLLDFSGLVVRIFLPYLNAGVVNRPANHNKSFQEKPCGTDASKARQPRAGYVHMGEGNDPHPASPKFQRA